MTGLQVYTRETSERQHSHAAHHPHLMCRSAGAVMALQDVGGKMLLCSFLVLQGFSSSSSSSSSPESQAPTTHGAIIWGPGLTSTFVVPARYFFLQATDSQGNNLTHSVGEDAYGVRVYQAQSGARTRAWVQVLDRHDGTYIVRFKLFDSYSDLLIDVMYNGKHVGESPYTLKGAVYNEKCYCPVPNLSRWMQEMECPASYAQIQRDLSIFGQVDMTQVEAEAVARFNQRGSHSLCHYVVKDNKIYRKTYGEHVGFKMFMDAVLLSMTRKVELPDFELFVNLGDWPLEKRKANENPLPIFSWCGSDDTRDIIMPTYDVTESTLETMGRVTLDLLSVQANTGPTWENKSSIGFWRGRDSRQERLDLVRMAQKHPDLIDARLTNMFFFKHDKEDLGELVKHISFFDFFKYKYQISVDGTVAAYRLPYLMGGDSLVLKQDSPYYEHFYKELKPLQHYLPFKRDLSDLVERLQWAKAHDQEAKKMAQNAQTFIRENLMARDVYCYHAVLFKEYTKKLLREVQVREGMDLVEQPSGSESNCQCHRLKKTNNSKDKDEL